METVDYKKVGAALSAIKDLNQQEADVLYTMLKVLKGISAPVSTAAKPKKRPGRKRARHFARWQKGDEAQLKLAYLQGQRVSVIARKLGRTVYSIRQRVKRLGLSR